jgi:hypothetical protein
MVDPSTQPAPKKLTLAEKVLALVAVVVVAGWVVYWLNEAHRFDLFRSPWVALSFFGALLVVVYAIVKLFGLLRLPPRIEDNFIPVVSLLPALGYLIRILMSLSELMTVGGSLLLAYLSVITYWRRQIPEFATRPLEEQKRPAPALTPPVAPGESAPPVSEA